MTTAQLTNGIIPLNYADFYKTGHPGMYPKATKKLVANFTPRSSKYSPVQNSPFNDNKIVWCGLTGFVKRHLIDNFNERFFNQPKAQAVGKYMRRLDNALGKGKVKREHVEALHDLGYLPLELRALREGVRVNVKVPPVLFLPTHEDFVWVATYFETLFSCEMWKPSTVGTIAFEFRKILTYFARLTGSPEDFVPFQGHDFSMRGMSGVDDAARCGAAHLLSFYGTDTIPAIDYLEDYYGADSDKEIVGLSVPATEHSVMTLRILHIAGKLRREKPGLTEKELRQLAELELFRELVTMDFPAGIVSIVADSFDFWHVITNIMVALKDAILARQVDEIGSAKVVIRPDSGDPVKILAGYLDTELTLDNAGKPLMIDGKYVLANAGDMDEKPVTITEAERKGAVECLWDTFGGTVTDKGYKLLNPRVGLIYGDSINIDRAMRILARLASKGFASGNVVFGIGSFTYQFLTRDCFSWAMKAIFAQVGDDEVEIYKDPATDDGTKRSAKGLQRVEKVGDDYIQYDQQTLEQFAGGELESFFYNSKLMIDEPASTIRQRLWESWNCPEPGSVSFPL